MVDELGSTGSQETSLVHTFGAVKMPLPYEPQPPSLPLDEPPLDEPLPDELPPDEPPLLPLLVASAPPSSCGELPWPPLLPHAVAITAAHRATPLHERMLPL